jgi:hypothetical protein
LYRIIVTVTPWSRNAHIAAPKMAEMLATSHWNCMSGKLTSYRKVTQGYGVKRFFDLPILGKRPPDTDADCRPLQQQGG